MYKCFALFIHYPVCDVYSTFSTISATALYILIIIIISKTFHPLSHGDCPCPGLNKSEIGQFSGAYILVRHNTICSGLIIQRIPKCNEGLYSLDS